VNKIFFAIVLVAALSVAAMGQEITARAAAKGKAHNWPVTLAAPHACTVSPNHPCIYYGGDMNLRDSNQNGLSNENTLMVPKSYTYTEVVSPGVHISASFSNNLAFFGVLDPQTATWQYRTGVSEGNGGTLIGSGDTPAQITDTHRNYLGFEEFEVLTKTPLQVPVGLVWFAVTPDCTNPGNSDCTDGRYYNSTTDGTMNAINGMHSVFSSSSCPGSGFRGPVFDSEVHFGVTFENWCNDQKLPASSTMSSGVLK